MLTNTQFITRAKKSDIATNFFELRKEGIQYLQELSGHLWTNFNAHDPGLILLETLCYVITELGYKSSFPIADILKSDPNGPFGFQENALYQKQEIFYTHPITLTDYRMLLIDQLSPTINNVWVEAITNGKNEFTGLYIVWLLPDDQITINEADIIQKTKDCMAAHRNLGEDIKDVRFLNRKRAYIHADVQLSNNATPDTMLAAFFHRLEEVFLNPTFKLHTEGELIEKGLSLDEIYNGPKTEYGHFDKNQLKPFPKHIEIEELVQILFQIDEGVLKVDNFKVFIDDVAYTESIPLQHFLPQFIATDTAHQLNCYQRGLKLDVDLLQVLTATTLLKQGQNRNYEIQLQKQTQEEPTGTKRDIATFLPLDYELPPVFGLGNQSLPEQGKAMQQRLQLQSYLQMMNVFLGNASKKLACTASFFSIFKDSHTKMLQRPYIELSKVDLQQRHLILDHLLARFNIKFPNYIETEETKAQLATTIITKEKCLQNIPLLTANRSAGANLNKPQWGTSNAATMSKWLHLYLGYPDFTIRSLTTPIQTLKNTILKKNRHLKNIPIAQTLLKGSKREHYNIVKNRKYFVAWLLLDNTKLYLGKRKTKADAIQVIQTYCETIARTNAKCKGLYLVEDFLVKKDSPFTISLFFPDWTTNIQSNRFKEFIKTQAVELLPTHIYAKFYALPFDEMHEFETFYKDLEHKKEKTFNPSKKYKRFQF